MPAQQQNTTAPVEATAPVAGATSTTLIDLVTLFSAAVQAYVSRQVMVLGDPAIANGFAQVTNTVPNGNEFALLIRIAPGSPELQIAIQELRGIRAELQTLNAGLGYQSPTGPALIDPI